MEFRTAGFHTKKKMMTIVIFISPQMAIGGCQRKQTKVLLVGHQVVGSLVVKIIVENVAMDAQIPARASPFEPRWRHIQQPMDGGMFGLIFQLEDGGRT